MVPRIDGGTADDLKIADYRWKARQLRTQASVVVVLSTGRHACGASVPSALPLCVPSLCLCVSVVHRVGGWRNDHAILWSIAPGTDTDAISSGVFTFSHAAMSSAGGVGHLTRSFVARCRGPHRPLAA